MTAQTGTIGVEREQVRRRLEDWRSSHARRARLPEPLWAEAVALARTQGLFQTARALRLDYASLKKRVQRSAAARPGAPPAFVEWIAQAAPNLSECVVELEGPRGGRMRIQWKATAPPDLIGLSRILWGGEA